MTFQRFDDKGNPIGDGAVANFSQPPLEESLKSLLQRTERELSGHYPMMVDSVTRMDAVTTESDRLHYHYSLLNASVDELDVEATREALVPLVQQQANEMTFLKLLMDKGAIISFHYADKDGKEITVINVERQ